MTIAVIDLTLLVSDGKDAAGNANTSVNAVIGITVTDTGAQSPGADECELPNSQHRLAD